MTERPILFSGPMVWAILEGRKTQTRRVVKPQPGEDIDPDVLRRCRPMRRASYRYIGDDHGHEINIHCPYDADCLWVRETWQAFHSDPITREPSWVTGSGLRVVYASDGADPTYINSFTGEIISRWRPSIHMPRWASRLSLEIVSIRVERVQEISEDDAKAEGARPYVIGHGYIGSADEAGLWHMAKYKHGFADLWDSINAKRGFGWDKNPWVWVIEFKRVKQ